MLKNFVLLSCFTTTLYSPVLAQPCAIGVNFFDHNNVGQYFVVNQGENKKVDFEHQVKVPCSRQTCSDEYYKFHYSAAFVYADNHFQAVLTSPATFMVMPKARVSFINEGKTLQEIVMKPQGSTETLFSRPCEKNHPVTVGEIQYQSNKLEINFLPRKKDDEVVQRLSVQISSGNKEIAKIVSQEGQEQVLFINHKKCEGKLLKCENNSQTHTSIEFDHKKGLMFVVMKYTRPAIKNVLSPQSLAPMESDEISCSIMIEPYKSKVAYMDTANCDLQSTDIYKISVKEM